MATDPPGIGCEVGYGPRFSLYRAGSGRCPCGPELPTRHLRNSAHGPNLPILPASSPDPITVSSHDFRTPRLSGLQTRN